MTYLRTWGRSPELGDWYHSDKEQEEPKMQVRGSSCDGTAGKEARFQTAETGSILGIPKVP